MKKKLINFVDWILSGIGLMRLKKVEKLKVLEKYKPSWGGYGDAHKGDIFIVKSEREIPENDIYMAERTGDKDLFIGSHIHELKQGIFREVEKYIDIKEKQGSAGWGSLRMKAELWIYDKPKKDLNDDILGYTRVEQGATKEREYRPGNGIGLGYFGK